MLTWVQIVLYIVGMSTDKSLHPVEAAIIKLNGPTAVARYLKHQTGKVISQQRVSNWRKVQRIPAEFVPYIVTALKDPDVTHKELCPDFPWEEVCSIADKGAAA